MRAFRVADRRFPIFDGTGARLIGGRWNSPGRPLIYCAESFAGAVLETLIHSNLGRVPRTHSMIEVAIPKSVRLESVAGEEVLGWDTADFRASRAFGDRWLEEGRSAVLVVPSMVTRGRERNILINPEHRDFAHISASAPQPVLWDERLFEHR